MNIVKMKIVKMINSIIRRLLCEQHNNTIKNNERMFEM